MNRRKKSNKIFELKDIWIQTLTTTDIAPRTTGVTPEKYGERSFQTKKLVIYTRQRK